MRVLTAKRKQTVTVYRGDVEAAKRFSGPWEDAVGHALDEGVSVDYDGKQWILKVENGVHPVTDVPPDINPDWKQTEFEIGVFTGTPLDPAEETGIVNKYTQYKKVKGQVLPDPDFIKIKLEKIRRVITGWDLVDDDTGEPVPCTDAMKEMVYLCNPEIIDDVMTQFTAAGRSGGYSNREIELKN